jgi:hypothetical protein
MPAQKVRWRSKTTSDPMGVRANGNTKRGRRIRDLFRALLDRIGCPDDVLARADVLRAAELKVAAEDLRARVLAGQPCEPNELVRLENLADRAARRLSKYGPAKTKTPLAKYLARSGSGS